MYANRHLLDTSTYQSLASCPSDEIKLQWTVLETLLKKYHKFYKYRSNVSNSTLSDLAKYLLQVKNNSTQLVGSFYMLMKVHKKELSGRPIISSINTFTYYASKYLDQVLQPVMKNISSFIQSSQHLIHKLEENSTLLPHDCWILCADVDSLYPSIPSKEGQELFKLALLRHNVQSTFFSDLTEISFICDLLAWVLSNNYFSFGNDYYLQINGTAMGTPVAVAYARSNRIYSLCRNKDFLLLLFSLH
jgi:hypothetical protein